MADPPEPQPPASPIGRDKIDARQSQGFVNRAETVTQNFIHNEAPAVRIPACPAPNAAELFGRAETIADLAGRLIAGTSTLAISAVRGLPGVGKSDLLRAIGNDARIMAHFAGGVLYAELGPAPDLAQWLRRWITALGPEPPRSDDPEALAAVVRATLRDRRALLILDDVWESSLGAARALRDCGSPSCRALASSRSPHVAQEIARGAAPLELDVLAAAPALELLRHSARDGAVDVVARDQSGAQALAAALGGLPLALKLAGGWLRANYRQPRYRAQPCAALLAIWRAKLAELRGHEPRPGLSDEQFSLDAIVGLSYAALPDDATRAAAAALATFGAAPLDFDWGALAAVWATGEEETARLEQALVATGLLDYDAESGRYSLHQVVEAFLAARADPAAYERHTTYYAALMRRYKREIKHESTIDAALAALDSAIGQMERGQQRAAQAEPSPFWDARLIDYALACSSYFQLRGLYTLCIAWCTAGRNAALQQGHERDVAMLLVTTANMYRRTGRYDEAIGAYQEAIALDQQLGSEELLAGHLNNLGNVYIEQRCYDEAITHYQQSLEIKRHIGDTNGIAISLGNIGGVYRAQGHYDEAIAHYQQSLELSRQNGNIVEIARCYARIGNVYSDQERYEEAIDYHQESLKINRRLGAAEMIAHSLWSLGLVYEKHGDLTAALPLFEEGAQIAERFGMPEAVKYRAKATELRKG